MSVSKGRASKGCALPRASHAGEAAILLCAVLWSTSGLFIKLLSWDPIVIAGARSLVAGLFMLAARFLSPARRKLPFKPCRIWRGALAYSLTMLLFVAANKLTTSANAILLQYSAPVWAALLGWLLAREKPHAANWISLVMMMGGLCLFFKDGLEGGSFTGNLLALCSGICFAANSVLLRVQKDGDTADSMLTAAIEPILSPVWVLLVTGEKPGAAALAGGAAIIAAVVVSSIRRGR